MEANPSRLQAAVVLLSITLLQAVNAANADDQSETGRWRYVQSIQRVLERPAPTGPSEDAGDADRRDAIMSSDEMLAAMSWIEHYFAVQVDYSDAEVAEFRRRLDHMSSLELRLFLSDFERERLALAGAHAGSTARRGLALSRDYGQSQSAASSRPPAAYFQHKVQTHEPRVRRYPIVREPLITSLDVARIAVYRYFWRW